MKVNVNSSTVFVPKTLSITFTSPEEVAKLFAIMNHAWVSGAVGFSEEADYILNGIKDAYGVPEYEKYHNALCNKFKGG